MSDKKYDTADVMYNTLEVKFVPLDFPLKSKKSLRLRWTL